MRENITGHSQRKRSDATRPLRSTRSLTERIRRAELWNIESDAAHPRNDRSARAEYDFLEREETRKPPVPFDDIPSLDVTRMCANGMIFWMDSDISNAVWLNSSNEDHDVPSMSDELSLEAVLASLSQQGAGADWQRVMDADPPGGSGSEARTNAPEPYGDEIATLEVPSWTTLAPFSA